MECLSRFAIASAIPVVSKATLKSKRPGGFFFKAQLNDDYDPLFQTALNSASLRFQETHRPGKLALFDLIVFDLVFSFRHFVEQFATDLICVYALCVDPLFVDPYAGCFASNDTQMDLKTHSHHYCLATKFIDDKLLRTANHIDGLKQVF